MNTEVWDFSVMEVSAMGGGFCFNVTDIHPAGNSGAHIVRNCACALVLSQTRVMPHDCLSHPSMSSPISKPRFLLSFIFFCLLFRFSSLPLVGWPYRNFRTGISSHSRLHSAQSTDVPVTLERDCSHNRSLHSAQSVTTADLYLVLVRSFSSL